MSPRFYSIRNPKLLKTGVNPLVGGFASLCCRVHQAPQDLQEHL